MKKQLWGNRICLFLLALLLGVLVAFGGSTEVHAASTDETERTIVLTKKISADDINFLNGDPTFLFRITGIGDDGEKHILYRMMAFDEDYVKANKDSEGYVSQSITIDGLSAYTYVATEMNTSRYCISVISDVVNGTISGDAVVLDLLNNTSAAVTFENSRYNAQDFSHAQSVTNSLVTTRVPGLYDPDTGELITPWDELIEEEIIKTNGGHIYTYTTGESGDYNPASPYLVGELVIPPDGSVTSIGTFRSCTGLTNIVIPDTITSISGYAFAGCSSLKQLDIPASVTSIGVAITSSTGQGVCRKLTAINVDEANPNYCSVDGVLFTKDMTTLIQYPAGKADTSYVIPSTVKVIETYAFECCENLTSIVIPDGVESIGNYAFDMCTGLTSVTIPDSVTSIGTRAFWHCSGIESLEIGSGLTSLGDQAFSYCTGMKSVVLPEGLETIGYGAFSDCTSLTSITIPDSVTSMGSSVFRDCTSLTTVTIGNSVASIDNYAFQNCSSLTSITIPDSVTSIGYDAFDGCTSLASITIPDSVTSIGDYAFYNCTSLTSIVIPDGVTIIDDYTFCGCSSLTSATIGSGVTSIGRYAFRNCTSLTSVTFKNTSGWWVSKSSYASSGTSVTVTDPANAATYLKSTYYNYYWKRS